MNIYSINNEIEELIERLIDPETGEIDEDVADELDELEMSRNDMIENIALTCKEYLASAEALKAEKAVLNERQKLYEKKADTIKKLLDRELMGSKFETPKVCVTYRKSEKALYDGDVNKLPEEFQNKKVTITANLTAIKAELKAGKVIKGAELVKCNNLNIK